MTHDYAVSNPSANPTFDAVLAGRLSRRGVLRGGLVAAGIALLDGMTGRGARPASATTDLLGFRGVPLSRADALAVPPGYTVQVLYAWGDPISDGPAFKADASNTADEQARQAGMHHDGLHFFPLPAGSDSSTRGLLAVNHEYTDDGLLHAGGMEPWTPEKVAKSQAAHGVSIVEVALVGDGWRVVRPSPYARRITGRTPMRLDGPAAGHPWLRTAEDPTGRLALGTTSALHKGDYATLGNNQMLAADPATGEVRRFLTGPNGCEVTGVVTTPDGRTMFVNIQHPGEPPASGRTRRTRRRSAPGPTAAAPARPRW